jgi:hypothetical protein
VQNKTIWLKTSEAGLVEAGSNPSIKILIIPDGRLFQSLMVDGKKELL